MPEPIENSEFMLEVDTVIPAIGEFVETECLLRNTSVETSKYATVCVDDEGRTSVKRIFAGGDVVSGPATVIEAIGAGERAAVGIDRYLRGEGQRDYPWRRQSPSPVPFDPEADPVGYPMVRAQLRPAEARSESFGEVVEGITKEAAMKESERCLRCDFREA